MRPYVLGETMDGVSISDADKQLESLEGGYIARNPINHEDKWYVAKDYFDTNLEEVYEDASNNIKNTKVFGLTFGLAIEALKSGKKVARSGWNGKGMFLWLLPPGEVQKEWVKDLMLLEIFGDRQTLPMLGSIRMKTATGEVLTGWLASQTDIFAEDWCIVE